MPVDADLAGIGAVEAAEDLAERALAGTVLAEQGMDLARPDLEIDSIIGEDGAESLDDAARRDQRRRSAARHARPVPAPRRPVPARRPPEAPLPPGKGRQSPGLRSAARRTSRGAPT